MGKFSPEARAFFDRQQPDKFNAKQAVAKAVERSPRAPEQAPLDQKQITRESDQLLHNLEKETGQNIADLVANGDPKTVERTGRILSRLLDTHSGVKKAAMVSALLTGLFANGCATNARLCAKLEAWDQRQMEKKDAQQDYWEWASSEIAKAIPQGRWLNREYDGLGPGRYFEIPAGSFNPYDDWQRGEVTGAKLPKLTKKGTPHAYSMKLPPPDISLGEFLLLATGHLSYVKGEGDSRARLVYSFGHWLTLGEIQDQQATMAMGPGEARLYPAFASKAHPDNPWDTIPRLKPAGDTYEKLWIERLGRAPLPETLVPPNR